MTGCGRRAQVAELEGKLRDFSRHLDHIESSVCAAMAPVAEEEEGGGGEEDGVDEWRRGGGGQAEGEHELREMREGAGVGMGAADDGSHLMLQLSHGSCHEALYQGALSPQKLKVCADTCVSIV